MGYITLQSDWEDLAVKAMAAINGDKGGTWAPSAPIFIDTSGMEVTGPAEVMYGGVLRTFGGSRFILAASDYPKLAANHVGRTRVIRSPMTTRMATPRYAFCDCPSFVGAIQSIALTVVSVDGLDPQPRCHIPIIVHDGGRLASGVLKYRVPLSRSKSPVTMPKFRIVRTSRDGVMTSLRAPSATVDADGYSFFPTVGSGDEWYAGGNAQSLLFTCDQNNVIDRSQYNYDFELVEEIGTSDPYFQLSNADGSIVRERKQDVRYVFEGPAAFTNNPNPVSNPTGPTLVSGDRVLIQGLINSGPDRGLWTINTAGGWSKAPDQRVLTDYTPYWIVYDRNRSILWECLRPSINQYFKVNGSSPYSASVDVIFQKRVPRGNIYHSLTCTFDQITDMRPQ